MKEKWENKFKIMNGQRIKRTVKIYETKKNLTDNYFEYDSPWYVYIFSDNDTSVV